MRQSIVRRLQQSIAQSLAGEERIVLAVSGGVDSMVLLDAAATLLPRDRLCVATFDHATGSAATAAAALVSDRAAALGIVCVSGAARASDSSRSEAALREARWRFLRSVAASRSARVATAHTLDDQIETVLMRIMRGAGARGIAGLFAPSDVLRPLLGVARGDVLRYARARRLRWIEDPSNASLHYLRNRLRHELLPALRHARPEIDRELLDIAQTAMLWRAGVRHYVDRAMAPRVSPAGEAIDVTASGLTSLEPSELAAVWPEIAARAGVALDRRGTERLAAFTREAKIGRRVQLSGGWHVIRSRDAFQLRASELSSPVQVSLDTGVGTRWDGWDFRPMQGNPTGDAWSAWLPQQSQLVIRPWRPGDVMRLRDDGQPRKVKYFLSDAGITGHERARWPVVLADDRIIWIPGVRRSVVATARSGRPALAFLCEHTSR